MEDDLEPGPLGGGTGDGVGSLPTPTAIDPARDSTASRTRVRPAGLREVWTRGTKSTRADALLANKQGIMHEALCKAVEVTTRAGAAGGKLGVQLR